MSQPDQPEFKSYLRTPLIALNGCLFAIMCTCFCCGIWGLIDGSGPQERTTEDVPVADSKDTIATYCNGRFVVASLDPDCIYDTTPEPNSGGNTLLGDLTAWHRHRDGNLYATNRKGEILVLDLTSQKWKKYTSILDVPEPQRSNCRKLLRLGE